MRKVLCILAIVLAGSLTPAKNAQSAYSHFVVASWYGNAFAARRMANGELFDPLDPGIAAHPSLPLGTLIHVYNPKNGKALYAVIKDRGPYVQGRSLDLSWAGARQLGYVRKGVAVLMMEIVR